MIPASNSSGLRFGFFFLPEINSSVFNGNKLELKHVYFKNREFQKRNSKHILENCNITRSVWQIKDDMRLNRKPLESVKTDIDTLHACSVKHIPKSSFPHRLPF